MRPVSGSGNGSAKSCSQFGTCTSHAFLAFSYSLRGSALLQWDRIPALAFVKYAGNSYPCHVNKMLSIVLSKRQRASNCQIWLARNWPHLSSRITCTAGFPQHIRFFSLLYKSLKLRRNVFCRRSSQWIRYWHRGCLGPPLCGWRRHLSAVPQSSCSIPRTKAGSIDSLVQLAFRSS